MKTKGYSLRKENTTISAREVLCSEPDNFHILLWVVPAPLLPQYKTIVSCLRIHALKVIEEKCSFCGK